MKNAQKTANKEGNEGHGKPSDLAITKFEGKVENGVWNAGVKGLL